MSAAPPPRDRIVVVGDLMNDIVATPRGPIREDTDQAATIRARPGGSAANTAAWLGALGAPVDYVGAVGETDAATHERIFREGGVEPHLQREVVLPTGSVVIVVEGQHRTMLTERGANKLFDPHGVTPGLLARAAALHVSAYCFLDGFGVRGARVLMDAAAAAGVPVSLNPGSIGYIRDFGVDRFHDAAAGVDVIFPSLREGEELTGHSTPERIAAALLERHETVVVSLGPDGAYGVTRGGRPVRVPAPRVRLVDPTGAGDAFAAGFLERWVRDRDLEASIGAGVMIAARAVVAVGGRPPV